MIQQHAEAETLTIRQLIAELRKRYPSATVGSYEDASGIRLENEWTISLSHNRQSCCGSKFEDDPLNSTSVEVAIFKPNGEWYLVEGMDTFDDAKTGVLCWQSSTEVFRIVDYIAQKDLMGVTEGRLK